MMYYNRQYRLKVIARFLCGIGAMGMVLFSALAGETVQFSHGTKRVILPDSVHQNLDFEKFSPSQRFGGSEVSIPSNLEMPSQSLNNGTSIKNKKLQDFIDQRLNWIFVTPDSSSSTLTPDEAFGIRKSSFEDQKQKKNVVEKYMEKTATGEKKDKKEDLKRSTDEEDELADNKKEKAVSYLDANTTATTRKTTDKSFRSLNSTGSSSLKENDDLTTGILPGNPMSDSSFMAILKGSSSAKDEKTTPVARAWKSEQDFQQILHPTKITPTINNANDPINMAGDNSRSSLQPVVGGLDSMDRFSTRSDSISKLGSMNRSGLGALDEYSSRVFSPSSLSPAMITPPTTVIQPKPSVLEIPKRKF